MPLMLYMLPKRNLENLLSTIFHNVTHIVYVALTKFGKSAVNDLFLM